MNEPKPVSRQNAEPDALGPIEAEVMAAFRGLTDAAKALDAPLYFDYIDREKFTGLSADGKAWQSSQELEKIISTGFDMVERIVSLEFPTVKVTVIQPTTAILVNEFRQTILLKDKSTVQQSGGGMQVWNKSSDKWKLVGIGASDARQTASAVF